MNNNGYHDLSQRINKEAKDFAKKYSLNEARVVNLLHKLAEINWYDSDYAMYTELEKSFHYMSSHIALDLFEKED